MKREKTLRQQIGKMLMAVWFVCGALAVAGPAKADIIWSETFEKGLGFWYVENGVWEVGPVSKAGPKRCYGEKQCAGTVLDGDYPVGTSSRLISPSIQLPRVTASGEIYLFFWHWFSYAAVDGGYVQVSTYDKAKGAWSDWVTLGPEIVGTSARWSRRAGDLTPYAGKVVRIAFYHTDCTSWCGGVSSGWYFDNVTIETTWHITCKVYE